MAAWNDFKAAHPTMAEDGRGLLYHFGVGLAFLGTVRPDGGPRLHPICPLINAEGLFAFIVPSPKRGDLHRDGRYSLHSFPLELNEDAFYLTGRARHITDGELRSRLGQQFVAERSALGLDPPGDDQHLFAFDVATAMLTRTTGHGDPSPQHRVWHSPGPSHSPASG
jgi:hypothetical protein